MDISKTIGTPEQQVLIDRVGERLSEISGINKLVVKGYIRKYLDGVLGDFSMKEISDNPSQVRMDIFMETAKRLSTDLNLSEFQTIEVTLGVYEDWKKEFNR